MIGMKPCLFGDLQIPLQCAQADDLALPVAEGQDTLPVFILHHDVDGPALSYPLAAPAGLDGQHVVVV